MWGPTYSYAMCIMEEMQWMRTKSVTAGDFFHGTLEVIERDDTVLLFFGEDETLKLTHTAASRKIFVAGALRAAQALVSRAPGYYTLDELLFSQES